MTAPSFTWLQKGVELYPVTFHMSCLSLPPCLPLSLSVPGCRAGDVASLSVEVVVNPTNENLSDKNPVSSRLLEVAGPELKEECKNQIISEWHLSRGAGRFLPASLSVSRLQDG
jgi:hypothetical protein